MSPPVATEPPRRSTGRRSKPAYAEADPDDGAELERGSKPKPKKVNRQTGMMVDAAGGAIGYDVCADEPEAEEMRLQAEEDEEAALEADPVPDDEARRRWPKRYTAKASDDPQKVSKGSDAQEKMRALRHCTSACVDGAKLGIGDDVMSREDYAVEFDPAIARVYQPSGKPLVPDYVMSYVKGKSPKPFGRQWWDETVSTVVTRTERHNQVPNYAMTYVKGKSLKPFGRLWWDETVSTVVTRGEHHNQIILHPTQDRILTIRENARLQGFPDYYKLSGLIKQKYIHGNAVAVPVARALGYSLGQAHH